MSLYSCELSGETLLHLNTLQSVRILSLFNMETAPAGTYTSVNTKVLYLSDKYYRDVFRVTYLGKINGYRLTSQSGIFIECSENQNFILVNPDTGEIQVKQIKQLVNEQNSWYGLKTTQKINHICTVNDNEYCLNTGIQTKYITDLLSSRYNKNLSSSTGFQRTWYKNDIGGNVCLDHNNPLSDFIYNQSNSLWSYDDFIQNKYTNALNILNSISSEYTNLLLYILQDRSYFDKIDTVKSVNDIPMYKVSVRVNPEDKSYLPFIKANGISVTGFGGHLDTSVFRVSSSL